MKQELPNVQTVFRKARGPRYQIVNIHWVIKKATEFHKKKSTSLTTLKPFTVWITTNWKILKEIGIPDYLTCVLWNLYAGPEATVRTGHGTLVPKQQFGLIPNWERSMSRLYVVTLLIWLICRVHHENAGLDETQAGIKISGRNISNLRYASDTTLIIDSEED